MHRITLTAISVAVCLLIASSFACIPTAAFADGQLVQVPDLSGFGNFNNRAPFASNTAPMRYQQIYAASAFPHGGTIDKIMFRNDEETHYTYGPTQIDLQVAFAYSARPVSNPSKSFALNIGDNFTVVLDGVIVRSNDGSLAPATFDFVLDVANTFTYDPTKGDLLLQVLKRDLNSFTTFDASASPQQTVTTRIYGGINSDQGNRGFFDDVFPSYGLVTQFEFASVPEPSSLILLAIGAISLLGRNRTATTWLRSAMN